MSYPIWGGWFESVGLPIEYFLQVADMKQEHRREGREVRFWHCTDLYVKGRKVACGIPTPSSISCTVPKGFVP